MNKCFFIILTFLIPQSLLLAQNKNVVLNWDYKNPQKQKVFELWKYYINNPAEKDSCWSVVDRKRYPGVDLLKNAVGLGGHFYKFKLDCNVLSISESGDNFIIRSAFYWKDDTKEGEPVSIMAITNVLAVREKGEYKLSNYINHSTSGWNKKKVGIINYIYPPSHAFDMEKANAANKYIDKLNGWFGITPDTITYFIPMNCTEGYRMVGFEYWQSEGQELNLCGFFDSRNNIIYANAYEGEFYIHEFTHLVNEKFPAAHPVLLAGMAAYINNGGSKGKPVEYHLKKLKKYKTTHNVDYNNFDTIRNIDETTNSVYVFGAIFCNAIIRRGGLDFLKSILEMDTRNTDSLKKVLRDKLNFQDFNIFLKKEFEIYLNQGGPLLMIEN